MQKLQKLLKIIAITVAVLVATPFIIAYIIKMLPDCTIDDGNFAGSHIVQTCNCIGYEHFNHWEAGADSICIGYPLSVDRN